MSLGFANFPTLPALVFVAELSVVTISTLRIIFIARGKKFMAPVLGFFEIIIWLFAVGQVMKNLDDWGCFFAFAAGFTLGNFLGLIIESWLALGTVVVRTVTNKDPSELIKGLQAAQFGVTSLDAEGAKGPVKMIFTVVPRKGLNHVLGIIRQFDPAVFYSVDEIRETASGIFPERRRLAGVMPSIFQPVRREG